MYRKTLHIFLLISVILSNLVATVDLEAKSRPNMTCKYFDSLMNNHEKCVYVYPGREVVVDTGGQYKELYREAYRFLSKIKGYKELMVGHKGVIDYKAYAVDLNGDRVEEIVLLPVRWTGEDTSTHDEMLRGATGIGDILVFQRKKTGKSVKWNCIAEMDGLLLRLERGKTNRYHDLIVHWHESSSESTLIRYVYNNSTGLYKKINSKHLLRCAPYSEYYCYHPPGWRR